MPNQILSYITVSTKHDLVTTCLQVKESCDKIGRLQLISDLAMSSWLHWLERQRMPAKRKATEKYQNCTHGFVSARVNFVSYSELSKRADCSPRRSRPQTTLKTAVHWEPLCLYCHDHEHSKYTDRHCYEVDAKARLWRPPISDPQPFRRPSEIDEEVPIPSFKKWKSFE